MIIIMLHGRRAPDLQKVTLCESCGQVCTANCRAEARYQRTRTASLIHYIH